MVRSLNEDSEGLVLNSTEAMRYIGVKKSTFYRYVFPHLTKVPIGNSEYIERESCDRFISERKQAPADK